MIGLENFCTFNWRLPNGKDVMNLHPPRKKTSVLLATETIFEWNALQPFKFQNPRAC